MLTGHAGCITSSRPICERVCMRFAISGLVRHDASLVATAEQELSSPWTEKARMAAASTEPSELEITQPPFRIDYVDVTGTKKKSKKRKRDDDAVVHEHTSTFDKRLSVRRRARHRTHDIILVRPQDGGVDGNDWLAQVLECRAVDETKVYLLVAWLYRPAEMPTGSHDYYGEYEVVPSNHLQIIDAMTVDGRIRPLLKWKCDAEGTEGTRGVYSMISYGGRHWMLSGPARRARWRPRACARPY
ncbi:hypothetical protein MRB53_037069 [Persea americana]|nr:hypothetical protein MRB53_037069 [Persea americana]